eukprot:scaffold50117_cov17-Tisochrysis_lutea.AAC.1
MAHNVTTEGKGRQISTCVHTHMHACMDALNAVPHASRPLMHTCAPVFPSRISENLDFISHPKMAISETQGSCLFFSQAQPAKRPQASRPVHSTRAFLPPPMFSSYFIQRHILQLSPLSATGDR